MKRQCSPFERHLSRGPINFHLPPPLFTKYRIYKFHNKFRCITILTRFPFTHAESQGRSDVVMNLMEKMRNYVASFFAAPKPVLNTDHVGLIDVYMERALSILFWQSIERTLRVFFLLNTLFW